MNKSDVAAILAKISAYDRRTVGEADIEAWTEALAGQVTVQDALTAVRDHFRESSDWLMPSAVIERARTIRRARVRTIGTPDIPAGLTQAQEREWVRVFWEAINDPKGMPPRYRPTMQDGVYAANRALDIREVPAQIVPAERVKALIAEVAEGKSMPRIPYDRPAIEWA